MKPRFSFDAKNENNDLRRSSLSAGGLPVFALRNVVVAAVGLGAAGHGRISAARPRATRAERAIVVI